MSVAGDNEHNKPDDSSGDLGVGHQEHSSDEAAQLTVARSGTEVPVLSSVAIKATVVADSIEPSSPATQYTQFSSGQNNSYGFAAAHAIARHAHAGSGSGSLLKKRFLLEDVLGQGGMGTVYKTKDLRKVEAEDPNPYIATKVLNQAFKEHPDAFVTLQQEAAKSHALAHPNIVTVHDFDRDGDTLFMTMELLQGDPLDRLIKMYRNKGIPKDKAFRIVRDLCAALSYAHQRHIIHADFKPGNVFVMDDGSAKVLDFGIARAASKETQRHTFDAAQLGALTPAYATIEMVNDEPLTFADDVYALACVTYEIITGRHPYENLSAADALAKGIKPKPPAVLNSAEWKALSHGLALEKEKRTPTVAQFNDALFPRRQSFALRAAVVLSVLSLMGVVWFAFSQHQAKLHIERTIAENIEQAQLCFAQQDFGCALEHSLVAVNLDGANKVANQLLKAAQIAQQKHEETQKLADLLAEGEACLTAQDDACAQVKAREALALDAHNLRAQHLSAAANNLEQNQSINELLQQADACLARKDTVCADVFVKKASELNANHPAVHAFEKKLSEVQQQAVLSAQLQQQKVAAFVEAAQACLNQKKYACAVQQADLALSLDAVNAQAMQVKQSVALIELQGRESEGKVAKIIAQARECLEKQKNYSCAIAKAEAALDLAPNNQEAVAIKSRAQETQRKIKETGFTIK